MARVNRLIELFQRPGERGGREEEEQSSPHCKLALAALSTSHYVTGRWSVLDVYMIEEYYIPPKRALNVIDSANRGSKS
jgi:hypothetical protein